VDISAGNRWVIYYPDVNIPANTVVSITLTRMNQAVELPQNSAFKVYVVRNRHAIATIDYNLLTTLLPLTPATPDMIVTAIEMSLSAPANKYQ
jgi:hypothetical protein